ncbi:MAG: NAD(P)/FAD-dependent oxidoreductase [Parvularculaceae bacterium]
MRHADVIIAGGGVIGLFCGWMLARSGVRALVVDSGGPAATNAAAGMLAPSFERSLHGGGDALAAFSAQSLQRWKEIAPLLRESGGVDIDFDDSGVLCVAMDDTEAAIFQADADKCDPLDRAQVLDLEPALSSSARCGWMARGNGQVDPRRVRLALRRAIGAAGGAVRLGRRVNSIESGKAHAVVLDNGERLHAEQIVIATGARLGGLGDLPADATFPIKGEALAVARSGAAPTRVVITGKAYLCPKADGRVVVGATEIAGDRSLNVDERRLRDLRAAAEAAFPALDGAEEIERWAGLRPATKDGAPIIGPAPSSPGVLYALGHYRNGILLAPATADAIVALVATGRAGSDIAAFSPARFNELGVS